ncbi:uncharacterized protein N0V89_004108 [Didymosphaeria variabile]|uniref:BHLH domain-containing protein n=1 Tax=Didymosphaeria variabile TaxID=1932322 RepID=A0A9W9CDA8_9PLEO|nr:uncharacterized protein N0V89_004108 [Didymosphaeria variabile]KAJ4356081.1 hypothetical protein N0V89_004108 [Didymosphaeria variabile]
MDEKDPSPFGYTFSADFFGNSNGDFVDNGGPSLLSDMEAQQLDSFFSHANPFGSDAAPSTFTFPSETPDLLDNFSGWSAVPPATIHNISTTIPDQALLHGFHAEQNFTPTQHTNHFASTADDLQAASTLYAQAHIPQSLPLYQHQPNGRSHSFHGVPSPNTHTNGYGANGLSHGMPLVATPATSNGLMHEQLAALLPHHDVPGSIDNTITTQLANSTARAAHEAELRERTRPSLKRAYTYGTDSSFNETGFQPSSKHESEEVVTKRLIRELHHAQPLARPAPVGTNGAIMQSPTGHIHIPPSAGDSESNEEGASDESSADDDEEKRMKKRRKRPQPATNGKRKSVSGAVSSKNRKMSIDDRAKKPRRKSMAGSKSQRENLTEEQKRSNHILSEQKRRNLIKRGFDDLHDLVPEIRNGGLSKSGVLTEAANFLQLLIDDNKRYSALLGADG